MKTVFIAGATGYLGRYLCEEYQRRGWYVMALVRDTSRASSLCADQLVEALATDPDSLSGIMSGADLVISALGITRQTDGLGYWDVDYQANLNLLREAEREKIARFAYVHVLNADKMRDVPLVAAKAAFVDQLLKSPLASNVIAPSGYFSDMGDFQSMAQTGRVWLFGDGSTKINPIHGADLAAATADAIAREIPWLNVGGPDILSMQAIAEMAFVSAEKPSKISYLPDVLRRIALAVLPWVTPRKIHGPAQFFLTAMARDMVGDPHGNHHLIDHFKGHDAPVVSAAPVATAEVRRFPSKNENHEA